MNILYVGDVMAEPGIRLLEKLLPGLRNQYEIDAVIAQAENTTEGRGINLEDFKRLRKAGVDFCTGGNWSMYRDETIPLFSDPNVPLIRPANYPADTPGLGYKYLDSTKGRVLVVSLLGAVVGRDADKPMDNPLQIIDQILEREKDTAKVATIVNFHGDYSSEKVVIGYYLDGRVTAVIGDHWHVPTADEMVLPNGTAHISDVGMCGVLHASLGVTLESIIPRWRDQHQTRNIMAEEAPYQFNAVLIRTGGNGLAESIEPVRQIIDQL
jgi:metallophosphoesterase (TIGR00282 family)